MELHEKIISSRTIYRGKIINLRVDQVRLPDGTTGAREVVEHSGAVAAVPLTGEGEVILVRQYRLPARSVLLEIPAGKLEPGEDPRWGIKRELAEEIGMEAGSLVELGRFYTSPGFSSELIYFYLARQLRPCSVRPPAGEFLERTLIPVARVREMIAAGEINDGKTAIGLLLALASITSNQ